MAVFTPKRLGNGTGGVTPVQLTTSATTIYTAPTSPVTTTTIKQILVTNTTVSATTFTIYLVKSGGTPSAANQIYSSVAIPANTTINIDLTQVVANGDFISALAGANSAVNITLSGIESV